MITGSDQIITLPFFPLCIVFYSHSILFHSFRNFDISFAYLALQQSILSRNQNISNQFDSLIKADSLGLLETVWFQRKYAKVHIWHTGILSLEQSIILEIEKKNVSHPSRKKQASAVSLFQLIVGIFTGETTSVTFKLPVNQTSSKMEVYSEQRGFTPRAPRAIFF